MDWICVRVCYIECNPTVYIVVFSQRVQFFFSHFGFICMCACNKTLSIEYSPIDLDLC